MTKRKHPWVCQRCDAMGYTLARGTRSAIDTELCTVCVETLSSRQLGWCRKGKHAAELVDFPRVGRACQGCILVEARQWREVNREHVRAYRRGYVEARHAEFIERSRSYYRLKREQILEQKKRYYQQNRAKLIAASRLRELRMTPEQRAKLYQRRKELDYQSHQYRRRLLFRRVLAGLRAHEPRGGTNDHD